MIYGTVYSKPHPNKNLIVAATWAFVRLTKIQPKGVTTVPPLRSLTYYGPSQFFHVRDTTTTTPACNRCRANLEIYCLKRRSPTRKQTWSHTTEGNHFMIYRAAHRRGFNETVEHTPNVIECHHRQQPLTLAGLPRRLPSPLLLRRQGCPCAALTSSRACAASPTSQTTCGR
ncbi:unnamed protein product, partial [Ectocarpus fasciculatus]